MLKNACKLLTGLLQNIVLTSLYLNHCLTRSVAAVQFCALFKLSHSLSKETRVQWQLQTEGLQVYIPHHHIQKDHQSIGEVLERQAPFCSTEVLSWEGTCWTRLSTSGFYTILKNGILKESRKKGKMSVFLISAQHERHWAAESWSQLHDLHLN